MSPGFELSPSEAFKRTSAAFCDNIGRRYADAVLEYCKTVGRSRACKILPLRQPAKPKCSVTTIALE